MEPPKIAIIQELAIMEVVVVNQQPAPLAIQQNGGPREMAPLVRAPSDDVVARRVDGKASCATSGERVGQEIAANERLNKPGFTCRGCLSECWQEVCCNSIRCWIDLFCDTPVASGSRVSATEVHRV